MKLLKVLALAGLMVSLACGAAPAAAPEAAPVAAAQDLLASMQAEKMLRMTAGMSRYANDKQRQDVMAKLAKVPPEEVYKRLAGPVAHLLSPETTVEMTRFYRSSYGKRVLAQTYNHGASLYATDPVPTAAEKADLKRPAYVKADKAFKQAEAAINHQVFVLVTEISRH